MRRIRLFIAVFASAILLLSSCKSNIKESSGRNTIPSRSKTEESSIEDQVEPLTSGTTSQTLDLIQTQTSSIIPEITVEDASREAVEANDVVYIVRVPMVTISGVDTTDLNSYIADDLNKHFNYDDHNSYVPTDYKYYINGNVLSIVVEMQNLPGWYHDSAVFNISISDGTVLTTDEFIEEIGESSEHCYELVYDTYVNWWSDPDNSLNQFEDNSSIGEYQVTKKFSWDEFKLYLNEEGHLCFAVIVPIPNGMDNSFACFDVVTKGIVDT